MQALNMIIVIHHQSWRCFLITWIRTDFLTALCCLFLCTFIIKFQSSCSNHNQISFCCFTEAEQRSTAYAKDDGVQDFSFCTCHYICFIPFWKLSTRPKHLSLAKGSTINICREWLHKQLNWRRAWGHGRDISKSKEWCFAFVFIKYWVGISAGSPAVVT